MKYRVGQTVRIIEEITRKTLEGEVISYTGMLPDKERTQVDLKDLESDVYTSHEDVRQTMIENATHVIDSIISEAVGINNSVFGEDVPDDPAVEEVLSPAEIEDKIDLPDDNVEVDLGNGMMAKVNLSGISDSV